MVPIATAADPFEAKLLAARLGAAGIVWELRGNVDGVYPIGPFQVLVEADAAGAAHDLLVDPLVDRSPGDPAESDAGAAAVGPRFSAVAVIAVIVVVVLFTVARMLAMG
jgi:hypothetical protein